MNKNIKRHYEAFQRLNGFFIEHPLNPVNARATAVIAILQALNLFVGTNYQLEISDDLLRWNDWGAPFQSSLSGSSSQLLMVTNANAFWRFRSVP